MVQRIVYTLIIMRTYSKVHITSLWHGLSTGPVLGMNNSNMPRTCFKINTGWFHLNATYDTSNWVKQSLKHLDT